MKWKKKFFIIYLGQAFSIIGSAAVQFAIIWYLTLRTESAITLTVAAIVGFLPGTLFGPFIGVWIDRYNRRTVMILADALIALSSILLALAFVLLKTPPIIFIYTILFLRGVGATFHMPAMQAAIPTLVPADQLTKAGGWGNFVTSGSNLLGPLLGAFLMGIIPIASIMLVDILGAAFAIICLLRVKIPDIPTQTHMPQFFKELKQGINSLKDNKLLLRSLPLIVCVGILYFPLSSLFPLLVLTHYHGEALHNGLVDVSFASGMLISSVLLGICGGTKRKFLMVSLSIVGLGSSVIIAGILPSYLFVICIICTFIMGISATYFNVPFYAYVQESTRPQDMGKVMSLLLTSFSIANPIGLALAGPISEIIGVNKWFILSGLTLIIIGALCFIRTKILEFDYMSKQTELKK